jgi:putative addiction module component (TIGR02574 family)
MGTPFKRLQSEAMKLTDTERADLAELLWASVAERSEIDAEWDAELARRVAALDAGLTASTPADAVLAEARRIIVDRNR